MDVSEANSAFIDLVPQWYEADCGPAHQKHDNFYTLRYLYQDLEKLLVHSYDDIEWLVQCVNKLSLSDHDAFEYVQRHFVYTWLDFFNRNIQWEKMINYLRKASQRTYENNPVIFNFVISNCYDDEGCAVSDKAFKKIIDPLCSSLFTYIKVDRQFNFLCYEEVQWDKVKSEKCYRFYPEFLHPICSVLNEDEYSMHLTTKGDILILNHEGLLAVYRKGRWKIYSPRTVKNAIVNLIGGRKYYRVGANLFEILFDLSFKRQGALLIFDPEHIMLENIQNPSSKIFDDASQTSVFENSAHGKLTSSVNQIDVSFIKDNQYGKRLFLELASVDGAIIFDRNRILAFGAMIKPHPEVKEDALGARTIAAHSAYLYGAFPFKVSEDGDVSIYFESSDDRNQCQAVMNFL